MTQPIVPVYLNQRIVFDVLAMLDNGLSVVERVQRHERQDENTQRRHGAEFGLSKALSGILKIGVSGETEKANETQTDEETDTQKYHTPASLLFKLREQLKDRDMIKEPQSDTPPDAQDIVEFTASLSRNPLISTFDAITELMDMAVLFADQPEDQPDKEKKKQAKKEREQNKTLQQQLTTFAERLRSGDTVDIISSRLPSGHQTVLTLETEYLNDPMMTDLVDGEFTVLGKVIRVLNEGDEDNVNLLRKTPLSKVQESTLQEMFNNFSQQDEFNLPAPEWQIHPPVLQILPVGIFA